ncbi:MAG: PAS domain S-box protein [Bacteroidetes bacterium]|nr:PAS domain S-box protein [Bacteroidota bacterium]MBU1720230.1 PAS domain S-box protein [Bacteroidota bacterium]
MNADKFLAINPRDYGAIILDLDSISDFPFQNAALLPIIGFTKNLSENSLAKARRLGCISILTEPVTGLQVKSMIIPAIFRFSKKFSAEQAGLNEIFSNPVVRDRLFRLISDNPMIWISMTVKAAKLLYMNRAAEKISGYRLEELYSREEAFRALYSDYENFMDSQIEIREQIVSNSQLPVELDLISKQGSPIHLDLWTQNIGSDSDPIFLSIGYETSRLVQQERELSHRLTEKELLLREVHHRVKNNLQVISSLINLQSNTIPEGETKKAFVDTQMRVKSMAMIHEKLYQSKVFSGVDFGEYLAHLASELIQIFDEDDKVSLDIKVSSVLLSLNISIPLGLICNEIFTNALKYAFRKQKEGVIGVCLSEAKGGNVKLEIKDDGAGFPKNFKPEKATSLGMQLVFGLADQIGATVNLKVNNGVCYQFHFNKNENTQV